MLENFVNVHLKGADQERIRAILSELKQKGFDVSELRDGVQIHVNNDNLLSITEALRALGVKPDDVQCDKNAATYLEPAEALREALRAHTKSVLETRRPFMK